MTACLLFSSIAHEKLQHSTSQLFCSSMNWDAHYGKRKAHYIIQSVATPGSPAAHLCLCSATGYTVLQQNRASCLLQQQWLGWHSQEQGSVPSCPSSAEGWRVMELLSPVAECAAPLVIHSAIGVDDSWC